MVNYGHGYEASAWYILEVTEGTTPATPSYLALANHMEIKENESPAPNGVRKSGAVDYASFQKGRVKPVISLTFHPTQANGLAFLVNFLSTDNSFTLVTKNQNTGQFFRRYVGCKVKTGSIKVKIFPKEDVVELSCDVWAWSIQYADVGGSSYEAIPTTAVNWSDVTIKIGGSTVTDWWDAEFTVDNDLYLIPDNTGAVQMIKRGTRECKGNCTRGVLVTDQVQTEIQDVEAATVVTFEIDLLSHTFQFNGGVYTDIDVTNNITDMQSKKLQFQGATLTIT